MPCGYSTEFVIFVRIAYPMSPLYQVINMKLVALQNGCLCCVLREDLIEQVAEIAEEGVYDHLVIEGTGIGTGINILK